MVCQVRKHGAFVLPCGTAVEQDSGCPSDSHGQEPGSIGPPFIKNVQRVSQHLERSFGNQKMNI